VLGSWSTRENGSLVALVREGTSDFHVIRQRLFEDPR
jgi:hypothetical protein